MPELDARPRGIGASRISPASSADELVATLPAIVWEADGTDYRVTYVSPRTRAAGARPGWVGGRPGGTRVDVLLPVVDAPAAEEPTRPEAPAGGSERVLVVDDAEVVAALAERFLANAGYRVEVLHSPRDVLERGAAGLDALVTDVVMPGMSGPQMVARLGTALPVVFISGFAADQMPPDLALGERRAVVSKPFRAAELLEAVRRVLDAGGVDAHEAAPEV